MWESEGVKGAFVYRLEDNGEDHGMLFREDQPICFGLAEFAIESRSKVRGCLRKDRLMNMKDLCRSPSPNMYLNDVGREFAGA